MYDSRNWLAVNYVRILSTFNEATSNNVKSSKNTEFNVGGTHAGAEVDLITNNTFFHSSPPHGR